MGLFGFNTDVESGGVTYHVMTEPRSAQQVFQTMVFVKGNLLAKRSVAYAGHPQVNEPAALQELLKEQHRAVVVALRAGEVDACFANVTELGGASDQTDLP